MEGTKNLTTKQLQRLEKKKKKMAAFLEIAKLNDTDRQAKLVALRQSSVESDASSRLDDGTSAEEKPSRKRTTGNLNKDPKHTVNTCTNETTKENEEVPNKKQRLTEEEYAKLKEQLKERRKLLQKIPHIRLKLVGQNASLTVNVKSEDRIPIFLSDIQHLLLYSVLGVYANYKPARWCHLDKYNRLSHTVVFIVEGLSLYHFMAYESLFPHVTTKLEHRLEVVTPAAYGGSVIEDLIAVPMTGVESWKLLKEHGTVEAAVRNTAGIVRLFRAVFPMQIAHVVDRKVELPLSDKFPRTQLLLSLCQMVEENYPVPLQGELARKYSNYVMTKEEYLEATEKSPMFGLDCEMCRTTTGDLELTRISVVDESLNVLYDSLVKPENPITDYLTQYSGITKTMLEDVTTTISDVQQHISKLLPADAILVGQSLNCDLHSLKMMHPYIIDTSVIFNITGNRYRKSKLNTLAREFLGEEIQQSKSGHCSAEDSMASMKLVQLKLANSVDYGDAVLIGRCDREVLKMSPEERKAFSSTRFGLVKAELKKYATSIFKHVTKFEKTAAIVGDKEVMNEYSKYLKTSCLKIMDDENFSKNDQVRLVIGDNNKHCVTRASQVAMEHSFTLCHIRITEEELEEQNIDKTFHNVNKWMKKLWKGTAINGLTCVIFAGQNQASNGACFLNVKKEDSVPRNFSFVNGVS